ncbi:MAG: hypothetical protein IPM47_15145 [Sphingobacteriales bacterium]|nr:MAG: hypothetical protein IPM47_15145 [Sphingobacteriales bacterium]
MVKPVYNLILSLFVFGCFTSGITAQEVSDKVSNTFYSTRLINAQTVETVPKKALDVRITHRFNDLIGERGGIKNLFGLDNVTDIRLAFEFGITDELTVGIGRSKGALGPRNLIDGMVKYRFLQQTSDNHIPVTVGLFANAVVSTMKAETVNQESETAFKKFAHRMSYDVQLMIARKFGNHFSLQVMPNLLYRNFVKFGDENLLFSLGVGSRIAINHKYAIILDYYQYFSQYRIQNNQDAGDDDLKYFPPLGIGFEIKTAGHVFHINFSNSPGIIENQYIPNTSRNWLDGEFRLGFNISRLIRF